MNPRDWRSRTPESRQRILGAVLRGIILPAALLAATISPARARGENSRNRFSINSRVGFNISADFKNLGGFPAQSNPGPATGFVDRFYDDGFHRVDSSGNTNGTTWFWGYQNDSQLPGNDTLVMNSSSAPASGTLRGVSDDPQLGAELAYFRVLGEDRAYRWGIEVAAGWLDITFDENRTLTSPVTRTSDAYALNGVEPPPPPYAGEFAEPGPSIGALPTRTVSTLPDAAVTTGQYSLEARAYSLRLGLRYESPFNDRVALQFGGGFSGAFVDSEFRFRERTMVTGLGEVSRVGAGSESDTVFGAYVGAGVTAHLTQRLVVFAGAQFEHLSDFNQQTGGKEAEIDFGNSIFVTIGLSFDL